MKRIIFKRQISALLTVAVLMSSGIAVFANEETGINEDIPVDSEAPEAAEEENYESEAPLFEDADEDEAKPEQEEEYFEIADEDETEVLSTGFEYSNGNTYYYVDGRKQTGWIKYGNDYLYADSNGVLAEDCWKKIDGKWYHFWSYYMETGYEKVDGYYYYFDNSGAMRTGWIKYGENSYYYAESNGKLVNGWKKIDGKWYYFSYHSMVSDGDFLIDGAYYYFNRKGAMQTGWIKDGSRYYYADSTGKLATGWKKLGGKWYYFSDDGNMQTGTVDVDNYLYYLSDSGAMRTGWIKLNAYGDYYYAGSDGKLYQNKWLKENGQWYYFDQYGYMETYSVTLKGKTYYFNDDGSCKNP